MARSSAKKPGEHKCRGTSAPVEGRDWVRIGGFKWLREAAEAKGKFIPLEYRKNEEGNVVGRRSKAQKAAEREAAVKAAEDAERAAIKAAQVAANGGVDEEEAASAAAATENGSGEESFLDEAPDQEDESGE